MNDAGTTLFVVRHGRTTLNAEGRLRGHLDVPLDDVWRAVTIGALPGERTVPYEGT